MAEENDQKKVFAHLMTWFRTTAHSKRWEMWESSFEQTPHDPERRRFNGQRDIAALDYPLTGVYDSSDPDAIEYQLLLMRLSGFDGVIVDWDGRRLNPYRHQALMELLPHLDRFGMQLIVCFEEWCGYWPPGTFESREAEIAAAREEARWLMTILASRDFYATVRGRKPVLVFRKTPKQNFFPEEWAKIREPVDEHGGSVIFPPGTDHQGFDPVVDGRFFWVGGFDPERRFLSIEDATRNYNTFLEASRQWDTRTDPPVVFGSAVSGFNDTPVWGWGNRPRSAPRYDGRRFETTWQMSIDAGADVVQIVTWNDWNEGSHIEPSDDFGYRYLELNKRYAAAFKGIPDNVPDDALRLPLRLYKQRKSASDGELHRRLDEVRDELLSGNYREAQQQLSVQKD